MNTERCAYRGEVPIILRFTRFVSITARDYYTHSMSGCDEIKHNIIQISGSFRLWSPASRARIDAEGSSDKRVATTRPVVCNGSECQDIDVETKVEYVPLHLRYLGTCQTNYNYDMMETGAPTDNNVIK